MSLNRAAAPKPRERIIGTARDLFRKHGIRGVGVDTIADAADTNKMTLYRHFGSKDELVVACLCEAAREADEIWTDFERDYPGDSMAQLHAWIRCSAECVLDDSRGCDMANAAVELAEDSHPARRVIEDFKKAHLKRLSRLCADAGIEQAEMLADTLWLLLEGARVSCQSVGIDGPSARFVEIGEAVIAAFAGRPQRKTRGAAVQARATQRRSSAA